MEYSFIILISLTIGIIVGAGAAWLISRANISTIREISKNEGLIDNARLNEKLIASQSDASRLQDEKAALQTRTDQLVEQLNVIKKDMGDLKEKSGATESTIISQDKQLAAVQAEITDLKSQRDNFIADKQVMGVQIAELTTLLEKERTQSAEKIQLLKDAEDQLANRFKTLANDILEDKSTRFTKQNKDNLDQLLGPLKTKMTEFQNKVEEVYVNEGLQRSALAEQVKNLLTLNNQLSEDAHNLTRALVGQAKTQGNWGEHILERVLEASGLRKEHEYDVQQSHTRDDGSRVQPDVVIHLPEERHLIVDAKMSLNAYKAHADAEQILTVMPH